MSEGPKVSMQEASAYLSARFQYNLEHAKRCHKLYERLKSGQTPFIAIAYCSDSRVQSSAFGSFEDLFGKWFKGCDIGNTFEDSGAMADYAVRHLHVPALVVLGHTVCGAIGAASGNYSGETAAIQSRLENLRFERGEHQAHCSQANVDGQVNIALEKYKGKIDAGSLIILGAVQDISGDYGGFAGQAYITNINGTTVEDKIKSYAFFSGWDKGLLDSIVKRLQNGSRH